MLTLTSWIKAAARCGFNVESIFRKAGMDVDLVNVTSPNAQPLKVLLAMQMCVKASRHGHFPFVLGENFAFEHLPDFESFVTTSPTLREALRAVDWARQLINPWMNVEIQEQGDEAHLVMSLSYPLADIAPVYYVTEATFAALKKFAMTLLSDGGTSQLKGVDFRHSKPEYAQEYEAYFGLMPRFGQKQNALIFDREYLDRPLVGAFPAVHQQAEYLVNQRLVLQAPKSGTLLSEIEKAYDKQPDLLGQGLPGVAEALNLHVRTLQRRLKDEGLSFTEVQDRLRFRLACEWLKPDGPDIETISERLGFSDRRSFTHAFKRWSGVSPSAFRAGERLVDPPELSAGSESA